MMSIPLLNVTRRLGAPDNWDHSAHGICHTLEICDVGGWMISLWQPSPEELKAIVDGKHVVLMIQGTVHPVVSLSVSNK